MTKDDRDLLEILKSELDFIEQGGYGRSVRTPWRPTSIFLDSPSCLNFSGPERSHPCSECLLMSFVPPERRGAAIPCHHIPLTPAGDTVHLAEGWGDQSGMEEIVKDWLRRNIRQLEGERSGQQPVPQTSGALGSVSK